MPLPCLAALPGRRGVLHPDLAAAPRGERVEEHDRYQQCDGHGHQR